MASTGDSRGVELDQFPAELINRVTIHKTPTASLLSQGLASTINMETIKPLDFKKRTLNLNVRDTRSGVSTGLPEGTGERQSFSYIDQFNDGTLGVAFGVTKSKDVGATSSNGGGNAWGRWDRPVQYNGQTVQAPGGFGEEIANSTSTREGAMAVLQFKPNKDFETTLDLFTSKGTFNKQRTILEGSIGCYTTPGQDGPCSNHPYKPLGNVSPGAKLTTVGSNTYLEAATMGVSGVIQEKLEGGDDSLNAWGWNTKFKTGNWTNKVDFARSNVVRNSSRFETTAGLPGVYTSAQLPTISWTGYVPGGTFFEQTAKFAGINYADRNQVKLTDVYGWSGGTSFPQAGYASLPKVEDSINSARFSGSRSLDMGMLTGVEAGINFSERSKTRTNPEGVLRILGGNPYGAVTIPGSATAYLPTLGINVATWNPNGSVGTIYEQVPKVDKDILNKDWSVNEKVRTAYVKGDLEGKINGVNFTGNIGGQLVNTDQSSTGFNVNGCQDANNCNPANITRKTAGTSYYDFNPSLNLNFDLGNDQVLRFGAAKVLTRANMGDLRASQTVNTTGATITGGSGNPELNPFRARSLDLSYEKYFGKSGYFSVAGFHKNLDNYIINAPVAFNFAPWMTAQQLAMKGGNGNGLLYKPVNGQGGNISGIEFAINVPFSMIHKSLNGFGIQTNFSSTSSSVNLPSSGFKTADLSGSNVPLPGLSKTVNNTRVYYEDHGFQISVASRKRSDFLGEISNFQDDRSLTYIKGDSVVDLQVGYEFGSGYLKGLSVLLQANNMTNAKFERYRDTPANSLGQIKYGKTYLMGVNYKY